MRTGKFNIVTDSQWGSTGKGAVATALAYKYRPAFLSTTNMANAGHTAVYKDDSKFIAKALPSASALNSWTSNSDDPYEPTVVVGSTAAFNLEQLLQEIEFCKLRSDQVLIHSRAGVITNEQKEQENSTSTGTKHIASTMQGCGAFLADKVMRRPNLKLARDYKELDQYINKEPNQHNETLPVYLSQAMNNGSTILHEGSQGFSLDINHGSHYPYCTSRGTTAIQNAADMGINQFQIGDVYLVIRPYPIRVGNVVEEGKTLGVSGGCYKDHEEITWAQVAQAAGAPPEVTAGELTTVTKRLRRVFSFSKQQLREAALVNGATRIALNFANYIDWSVYGANHVEQLTPKVCDFISMVEDLTQVPVTFIGTGPRIDHCIITK
jgi:adenylosuccinate synthase